MRANRRLISRGGGAKLPAHLADANGSVGRLEYPDRGFDDRAFGSGGFRESHEISICLGDVFLAGCLHAEFEALPGDALLRRRQAGKRACNAHDLCIR
jgi:hypothetical protein